ncbi:hypothetical protein I4J89_35170 [Actinoplanes sp. NEAU-A11]|uniref:Protein kinase domain-containing protein n=2 Tax=Actinoplanes aureus TaxID=2792083 RepID=A0A931G170_9ACTN|nr:hypothetical protein [Actinoplanes aureus]
MMTRGGDAVPGGRAEPIGAGDPARVGAYRIIGRLGAGGMGTVYLGESDHGRLVAVKVVRPALASDEAFRRRFRTEVQRARQVPPFCTAEVLDADPATQHTLADQMVGTVAYMAPERFDNAPGKSLTVAADIFAWGAVVAYAGTGRSPFDGGTPLATATRIMTEPPDLTGLAGPLRKLVEAALQKRAADRPAARELLDLLLSTGMAAESPALRNAAQEVQTTFAGVPRPIAEPGPTRGVRRRRLIAAVLTAGVGMAALGLALRARLDEPASRPGDSRPQGSAPSTARPFRFAAGADVADPLTRPEVIRANSDNSSSCRYAGALVVTVARDGTYECGSTSQRFAGAHRISVEVDLRTAGSCAAVQFLGTEMGSYGVNVCAHGYVFNWYEGDSVEELGTYLLPDRTRLREPHRVAIEIRGDTAALHRDAREIAVVELEKGVPPGGGKVLIGGYGDPAGGKAPYQVAFRNLEIIG